MISRSFTGHRGNPHNSTDDSEGLSQTTGDIGREILV